MANNLPGVKIDAAMMEAFFRSHQIGSEQNFYLADHVHNSDMYKAATILEKFKNMI